MWLAPLGVMGCVDELVLETKYTIIYSFKCLYYIITNLLYYISNGVKNFLKLSLIIVCCDDIISFQVPVTKNTENKSQVHDNNEINLIILVKKLAMTHDFVYNK